MDMRLPVPSPSRQSQHVDPGYTIDLVKEIFGEESSNSHHQDPPDNSSSFKIATDSRQEQPWNPISSRSPYQSKQDSFVQSEPELCVNLKDVKSIIHDLQLWNEEADLRFKEATVQLQHIWRSLQSTNLPAEMLRVHSQILNIAAQECKKLELLHQTHFQGVSKRFVMIYDSSQLHNPPRGIQYKPISDKYQDEVPTLIEDIPGSCTTQLIQIGPNLYRAANAVTVRAGEQQPRSGEIHDTTHYGKLAENSIETVGNDTVDGLPHNSSPNELSPAPQQGKILKARDPLKFKYNCKSCDKSFTKKSILDQHATCHITECLFPCAKCPKRFKRLKDRARHQDLQHGEKSFVCGHYVFGIEWGCQKRFARKDSLVAHFRTSSAWTCLQPFFEGPGFLEFLVPRVKEGEKTPVRFCCKLTSKGCQASFDAAVDVRSHLLSEGGRKCALDWVINEILLPTCHSIQSQNEGLTPFGTRAPECNPSSATHSNLNENDDIPPPPILPRRTNGSPQLPHQQAQEAPSSPRPRRSRMPTPINDVSLHVARISSRSPCSSPKSPQYYSPSSRSPTIPRYSPEPPRWSPTSTCFSPTDKLPPRRSSSPSPPLFRPQSRENLRLQNDDTYNSSDRRCDPQVSDKPTSSLRSSPARALPNPTFTNSNVNYGWKLISRSHEHYGGFPGEDFQVKIWCAPLRRGDIQFWFSGHCTRASVTRLFDERGGREGQRSYALSTRIPVLSENIDQEIKVDIHIASEDKGAPKVYELGELRYKASSGSYSTGHSVDDRRRRLDRVR